MGGAMSLMSVIRDVFRQRAADTTQWADTMDWTVRCDWLQVESSRIKYMYTHNTMLMRAAVCTTCAVLHDLLRVLL